MSRAEISLPFPPRESQHVAAARAHLERWVTGFGLVRAPAARDRFGRADFGWFAAVTYPQTDEAGLCLIADWFGWLFLLDDQLDDGLLGRDPGRAQELMAEFGAVLTGAGLPERHSAIAAALADLWRRTAPRGTAAWRERFVAHVVAGGAAAYWEAGNRVAGIVPDEPGYIEHRRHTGAIYVCMDLVEVVRGIDLPPAVYDDAPFQDALRAACDVVCWTNDLYSLDKETALGERHNLVTVVSHARRLSTADAVRHVVEAVDREVRVFEDRGRLALGGWPEYRDELAAYLDGMRSWMRGNLDWSSRTRRYRIPAGGTAAVDYVEAAVVTSARTGETA